MKDADAWFEEGMRHIEMSFTADYQSELRGDLEDALAAFEQALALRPGHPQALEERAAALARLDRHEEALAALAQAIRVRPQQAELYLRSAQSLARLGRSAEALAACDEVLATRPHDVTALQLRAQALDALGRIGEALAAWDRFLGEPGGARDFSRTRGRIARAVDLAKLGRDDEAVAAFRELMEGGDAGPLEADLRAALGAVEAARTAFADFLAARAEDPLAWLRAGHAYGGAGRAAEALQAYEKAARLAPGNADAWWGIAEALVRLGRHQESIAMFDEALRLHPGYLGAKTRREVVLRQMALARDGDDSKLPGARA